MPWAQKLCVMQMTEDTRHATQHAMSGTRGSYCHGFCYRKEEVCRQGRKESTLGLLLPRSARVSIARKSEFCRGGINALLSGTVVPCRDHCSQYRSQGNSMGNSELREMGEMEEISQESRGGCRVITIYCRSDVTVMKRKAVWRRRCSPAIKNRCQGVADRLKGDFKVECNIVGSLMSANSGKDMC